MDRIAHTLSFALRRLRRSPGSALAAVLALALGLGAAAAIAELALRALAGPLPYRDGDRLVYLWSELASSGYTHAPFAGPEVGDLADRSVHLAELAAVWPTTGALVRDAAGREPQAVAIGLATSNLFSVLGTSAQLGRTFGPEDGGPGASTPALVSGALWRSRFGADPGILGRTLRVDGGWGFDGGSFTVVGVLPDSFRLLLPAASGVSPQLDLWVPFGWDVRDSGRSTYFLRVIGRLAEGANRGDAASEVAAIGEAVTAEHAMYAGTGRAFRAAPLRAELARGSRPLLLALLAGAGLLLVLCWADVAHLVLARVVPRRSELAVRLAQGASRTRVRAELVAEAALLALGGAAVAALLVRALPRLLPYPLPELAPPRLSVLAFAVLGASALVAVAAVTPLLGRAIPRGDLADALRGVAGAGGSQAERRGREALVLAQVAIGTTLLVSAGLLGRTFFEILRVDRGFDENGVLTFQLALPGDRYGDVESIAGLARELETRLGGLPGVAAVGAINQLPLDRLPNWSTPYTPRGESGERPITGEADARLVSPGYFDAVGTTLTAGRPFTTADDARARPVAIVDELFAARVFAGRSAVGEEIEVRAWRDGSFQAVWAEVVGVVSHARNHDLAQRVREQVYLPLLQSARNQLAVAVRASGDLAALAAPIRAELARIDPELASYRFEPLASYVARASASQRLAMLLAGAFSAYALLLAFFGIYGVLTQLVAQRTREIGVRLALGAGPARVVRLVGEYGARPVVAGLLLGLGGALAPGRALERLLFAVEPSDPATFAASALLVLAVSALALLLPARRASRVDPLVALRHT